MAKQRIAGISFEHAHMGDLLREAHGLAGAEIVAVCDEDESAHGRGDRQFRHSQGARLSRHRALS